MPGKINSLIEHKASAPSDKGKDVALTGDLAKLPQSVLDEIFRKFHFSKVANLALTCKYLYQKFIEAIPFYWQRDVLGQTPKAPIYKPLPRTETQNETKQQQPSNEAENEVEPPSPPIKIDEEIIVVDEINTEDNEPPTQQKLAKQYVQLNKAITDIKQDIPINFFRNYLTIVYNNNILNYLLKTPAAASLIVDAVKAGHIGIIEYTIDAMVNTTAKLIAKKEKKEAATNGKLTEEAASKIEENAKTAAKDSVKKWLNGIIVSHKGYFSRTLHKGYFSRTLINIAAENGQAEMLEYLWGLGCKTFLKNNEIHADSRADTLQSPLLLAINSGHEKIISTFAKQHKARVAKWHQSNEIDKNKKAEKFKKLLTQWLDAIIIATDKNDTNLLEQLLDVVDELVTEFNKPEVEPKLAAVTEELKQIEAKLSWAKKSLISIEAKLKEQETEKTNSEQKEQEEEFFEKINLTLKLEKLDLQNQENQLEKDKKNKEEEKKKEQANLTESDTTINKSIAEKLEMALLRASKNGNVAAIKTLLQQKYSDGKAKLDVNAIITTPKPRTALYMAVENKQHQALKTLLQAENIDPDNAPSCDSPLGLAVFREDEVSVGLLLKHGASIRTIHSSTLYNLLYRSIKNTKIKQLIQDHMHLYDAIAYGDYENLPRLLQQYPGANIHDMRRALYDQKNRSVSNKHHLNTTFWILWEFATNEEHKNAQLKQELENFANNYSDLGATSNDLKDINTDEMGLRRAKEQNLAALTKTEIDEDAVNGALSMHAIAFFTEQDSLSKLTVPYYLLLPSIFAIAVVMVPWLNELLHAGTISLWGGLAGTGALAGSIATLTAAAIFLTISVLGFIFSSINLCKKFKNSEEYKTKKFANAAKIHNAAIDELNCNHKFETSVDELRGIRKLRLKVAGKDENKEATVKDRHNNVKYPQDLDKTEIYSEEDYVGGKVVLYMSTKKHSLMQQLRQANAIAVSNPQEGEEKAKLALYNHGKINQP